VELKPWQQRMMFGLVVVGLAVLGLYLVGPALRHNTSGTGAAGSPSPTPSAAGVGSGASTGSQAPVAATAPASVNIYNWLPFTQTQLADAVGVVTAFCSAYDTYRYTDSAGSYTGRMNGLVSGSLAGVLRADYETPGVASQRVSQRQVSSGSGTIDSIRSFGSSSIQFVATITQRVVSARGSATNSTQYAVTVVASASGWLVNDIELATAGNP
jgi:hypothetical protein